MKIRKIYSAGDGRLGEKWERRGPRRRTARLELIPGGFAAGMSEREQAMRLEHSEPGHIAAFCQICFLLAQLDEARRPDEP